MALMFVAQIFAQEKPNILLIQADDLGYCDLSIHGNPVIKTPNLDKLGRESLRFTHFYVHSVCSPTRASLLTGRYSWRTGVWGVHGGCDFMNLDEVTIAEVLKGAGYTTGMWGKWHTGKTDGYYPWDRGFDEAYFAKLYKYSSNTGLLNGKPHTLNGWTCSGLTDMAIEFIRKNREGPFFAYLPYLTPHGVWHAPPEEIEAYQKQGLSREFATLAGMITYMDKNVGRLMAALDAAGLRENTIVMFMSDNGPTQKGGLKPGDPKLTNQEWRQRNTPLQLHGNKGTTWQNGIRSPLFIRWPGIAEPGTCDKPLSVMDVFPTFAEITKAKRPANGKSIDGRSFAKLIANPKSTWPDREIFVSNPMAPKQKTNRRDKKVNPNITEASVLRSRQDMGMITAKYKYLETKGLYDLVADPRESKDLRKSQPEIAKRMQRSSQDFLEDILEKDDAFTRPVFLVGLRGAATSLIWAYGAAHVEGKILNENHALSNWVSNGDSADFDLLVKTAGTYAVEVNGKGVFGAKLSAAVRGGKPVVVYTKMPKDITSCKGVALSKGEIRLTLSLQASGGKKFSLNKIMLHRLE